MKILLLEDDETLLQTIISVLRSDGYDTTPARNGEEALDLIYSNKYDLYLFDVNTPLINGFDLLSELRNSGDDTTAFFITALNDTKSISLGFNSGADDYIKKPFDLDEFLIRVRAVLKRKSKNISYGVLSFNPVTMQLNKNSVEFDLSPIEKIIFSIFIKNVGKTVFKELFFDVMEKPSDMALRVHITKLKQKLSINISNVRSVGYRLEAL